jgi:stage V sporulation protein S
MEILHSNEEPLTDDTPQPEPQDTSLVAQEIQLAGLAEEAPPASVPEETPPTGLAEEAPPASVPEETPPPSERPSVLKVSARSRPSSVAGAIAGVIRETGRAEVQSIGAGATNQAIKSVAVARSYLQEDGIDIVCIPGFTEVLIEQEERTAIRLVVEKR